MCGRPATRWLSIAPCWTSVTGTWPSRSFGSASTSRGGPRGGAGPVRRASTRGSSRRSTAPRPSGRRSQAARALVCSDPAAGGDGCTLGAAAGKGGLLAQGLAKVGGVLGTVRVPTEVSIGLHMRDLAAVWLLAAAATAGVFALATCWLRRPAAKAAVFGRNTTEEWRAPAPAEAPRSSQEEWVRAAAARRPAARSKLQQKMPQVVRDDSDEGELDG
ncbi:unnamed protein product [Prorocentrum cordatum]|uniref:Transmembrane protein n=1 Tax=Prorocentrum cordatum TaxID=2364126 RepID=A0ABN9VEH0_9DINO|nr:unnamed protein product [Polarella glacialis]